MNGYMKSLEVVLFDLDGTLIDNTEVIVNIYRSAVQKLGKKPPSDDFIASLGGKSTFDTAKAMGIEQERWKEVDQYFWEEFEKYCNDLSDSPVLLDGVKELLHDLSDKGVRIGIVTSNDKKNAVALLSKAGVLKYFEVIIGKKEVNEYKPSGVPIVTALQKMGLKSWSKENVVYIGDTISDVKAAKNAGVFSIQVTSSESFADLKSTNIQEVHSFLFSS